MNMSPNIRAAYQRVHKYINNAIWIMGEKVLTIGLLFISNVFVARYLGPEGFGALAYALSLCAIFGVAGHMGLSSLVVREIVTDEAVRGSTLGTVALLKLLGLSIGYAVLLLYAVLYEGTGSTEFYLIALAGAALLFRPADVIDFWFQAFVQARYTAMARIASHIAATILKLGLVFAGASLVYFATAQILQGALASLLLVVFFWQKADLRLETWYFDWARAKALLGQGWLIYLGTIFSIIYLKVDQVMLRWLADAGEVGQYAVAAQMSEAWYFVPAAIVTSIFPKLIALRRENEALFKRRFQQLLDSLFLMGLLVAVLMTLAAPWVIDVFFGADYAASAAILVVHIWAAIFIFMRAAFSKWILIENALVFSLITQGMGALMNIGLNIILIPAHGGIGAAFATLLSYATASFLALVFHPRTRPVFWQMAWAVLAPIRYPLGLACAR
jgi:O-antigen/teichoic acid export membrane protein